MLPTVFGKKAVNYLKSMPLRNSLVKAALYCQKQLSYYVSQSYSRTYNTAPLETTKSILKAGHYKAKMTYISIIMQIWITLTSIARLVHVNDLNLTTQILVPPCYICSVYAIKEFGFMAYTEQMWHGETKIRVIRLRLFTWTSPAMLVNSSDYSNSPIFSEKSEL